MSDDHFRGLERLYQAAPCNLALKPEVTITEGKAQISIAVQPTFFHAAKAVHGNYYFKMLDDAAFFASNSVVPEHFVFTASFNVQFFRPINSGQLIGHGEVTKAGKKLVFARSRLTDADGNELAVGQGTFSVSSIPLATAEGYSVPG